MTAGDVMTSPVVTVRPETTVKEIAALMVAHHISGLPVVTDQGDIVGIVTEADLLQKERGPRRHVGRLRRSIGSLIRRRATLSNLKKVDALTARELMSAPVITVEQTTPLREIAALMVESQINRVPVMRAGRLVGIVSRADVMRAFTRTDAEVAAAVRSTLLHDLWVDVSSVGIDVHDGVVILDGHVERRSECDLVTRWVASIDGVVAVESRLTYEYDDRGVHLGERWPAPRI
jgi:CBS domain-containing protein